jgi:hypothetical protein
MGGGNEKRGVLINGKSNQGVRERNKVEIHCSKTLDDYRTEWWYNQVEHRDENCTKMELQSSAELEP